MLVDSFTARCHKRKDHKIEEAINVSIDWSIRGSLSLAIIHIKSSGDTHLDHGTAELLEHFSILVKALFFEIIKEAVNFLLLSLRVVSMI